MRLQAIGVVTVVALVFVPAFAHAQAGRRIEGDFVNEHGSRHYVVWAPSRPTSGMPMVVLLHGCLQDPSDIARGTRFDERADELGFVVLYPEQPEMINPTRCWRWFSPEHQGRGSGEPALIAALTRKVAEEYRVDPRRIFVAGISAGGAMALNLVTAYPDVFAAAAVHSGLPYGSATTPMQAFMVMRAGQPEDSLRPERILQAPLQGGRYEPRPLFVIHGGKDHIVAPRNGEQLAHQWKLALERALGRKLQEQARDTMVNGRSIHRVSMRDTSRVWIDLWTDRELGHAWSGGSKAGTYTDTAGVRATDLIVSFFGLTARP